MLYILYIISPLKTCQFSRFLPKKNLTKNSLPNLNTVNSISVDTASQHFKKSHTESMFWLLCKKYCESFYMKIHYILKMVSVCFAVSCFYFIFWSRYESEHFKFCPLQCLKEISICDYHV